MTDPKRVHDAWWCDIHQDIHRGDITDFAMSHRMGLHPLYAHLRHVLAEGEHEGEPK